MTLNLSHYLNIFRFMIYDYEEMNIYCIIKLSNSYFEMIKMFTPLILIILQIIILMIYLLITKYTRIINRIKDIKSHVIGIIINDIYLLYKFYYNLDIYQCYIIL